jgi:hypothetical protein
MVDPAWVLPRADCPPYPGAGLSPLDVPHTERAVVVLLRPAETRRGGYALTPLGNCPPRPCGKVCSFSSTGLPSQIA